MSKFLVMFRMLRKQGLLPEQMHEFGRCAYAGGTTSGTRILYFLQKRGFQTEEIIGFGQWIYDRDIANDPDLTLKEVLELTVSGFSNYIIPALVRTYHKSRDADEAIAAFYFLRLLGVNDMFENGSAILLLSAKHACSYDLNDSQRVVVKSIIAIALEPAVESFDRHDVNQVRNLLDTL